MLVRLMMKRRWKSVKEADDKRIALQISSRGVLQIAGVPYMQTDNPMHELNVYYPNTSTNTLPTIIDIHGGGWMYGDCNLNKHYCMYLASKGFTVVSISYRLLPDTDLKGQVSDIFNCLHWLKKNARSYHCDLSKVMLTGDSAGGHLAGLTACCLQSEELQKAYDVMPLKFKLNALCINHGACDIYSLNFAKGWKGRAVQREMLKMMFGFNLQNASWYKKASFEETANGLRLPPILIISSEADSMHAHSLNLEGFLKITKSKHKTLFWDKVGENARLGHVFNVSYPEWEESIKTNDAIIEFFKENI